MRVAATDDPFRAGMPDNSLAPQEDEQAYRTRVCVDWAASIPSTFLLLFVLVPASAAVLVQRAIQRVVPPKRLIPHHDVAGFLVAIVGVLYAVVLGFVVVTVWANFDSVQRTADLEAGAVGDTIAYALMLPQPESSKITSLLDAYAYEVRDREWELLAQRKK